MLNVSSGFGDGKYLMSEIYVKTLNKTSIKYEKRTIFQSIDFIKYTK